MKTGLTNIGVGILIAIVGVFVTGLTYSMVSRSGGSYVVAYGAFVVGAWRFLLGLFQVLRSAVGGGDGQRVPASASPSPRIGAAATTDTAPARGDAGSNSNAIPIVGGLLIADAVLRLVFLGLLVWRVPSHWIFNNSLFLLTAILLPLALAIGSVAAGVLCLRRRPQAIAFGIGLCAVGLLIQAFGLLSILSRSPSHVPWQSWVLIGVHYTVYIAAMIVFMRLSGRRGVAQGFAG